MGIPNLKKTLLFLLTTLLLFSCGDDDKKHYDVLILGDGTGAVAAGIQSARSGAKTLHVTTLPWLGGMLTSAGVSATDGNHNLPAGLWGEFREKLRTHYGGPDSLFTGWVSNTMFEPSIGDQIWKEMASQENNLTTYFETSWADITWEDDHWQVFLPDRELMVTADVLVDGTDLGDVLDNAGADFDLGIDSRAESGESIAPEKGSDIIQDLTYCAILEKYDSGTDHLLSEPEGYDPSEFYCSCRENCDTETHTCAKMLDYGKLPNGQYMINWPNFGNDFYANSVKMNAEERNQIYKEAKEHTRRFIYYIQHDLGFSDLGLSPQFGTIDSLPWMPYHREGRRLKGKVRMDLSHITDPYDDDLYKTGIAVGDYPLDHHHDKNPNAPQVDFPPIPSYNVPLGALIPEDIDFLVVADKPISVTHLVNGTSRLQPVIIQIGQVAGIVAAQSAKTGKTPSDLSVRDIQKVILSSGGYLMPFFDVSPDEPDFLAIQKIGSTGLLRGTGVPYQWANRTMFYPDSLLDVTELLTGMKPYIEKEIVVNVNSTATTGEQLKSILQQLNTVGMVGDPKVVDEIEDKNLTRREAARFLDKGLDWFSIPISLDGR